ncbi:glycosyltransferase [Acetatifactor aquisgranensis]|uniref:glycosyltransferase n=1 Tax=Acetatifactor aquisgranensis TaxID=2941233 RepID=UPI00204054F2|nr:glycosyltransferase [Acetatifactor aquisgranensis]
MTKIGNNKWLRKIYRSMESGRARKLYLRADSVARKYGGALYGRTIKRLKHYVRDAAAVQDGAAENGDSGSLRWNYEKKTRAAMAPLVSVILPVTAHSGQLKECLECACNQSYPNIEILILEYGLAEEDSRAIAEYIQSVSIGATILSCESAPGALAQWNEGLRTAKGSYLWFVDRQYHYGKDFLRDALAMFSYGSVRAVFAGCVGSLDTCCKAESQESYSCGLAGLGGKRPFYMTAHDMVHYGVALWSRVPSLGRVVFKNRRPMAHETVEAYSDMEVYAAWIFILYMIRGGVVGYYKAIIARRFAEARSNVPSGMEEASYYKEMESVSSYIARHYKVEDGYYESVLQYLEGRWGKGEEKDEAAIRQHYCPERILAGKKERRPNVLLACYALRSGGGEVYPIHLANELCRQGLAVTLVNFNIEEEEEGIRQLIDNDIPVVTIRSRDYLKQIVTHLGGEIIHSHCASVDEVIAQWRKRDCGFCHHVITLHGMYEAMEREDCDRVIADTWESGAAYIYIADKNLECFRHRGHDTGGGRFAKIPNGLPAITVTPMRRDALGIPGDAFVLVTAGRGIPEKGWKEAVRAVAATDGRCSRPVHLVVVGDGETRAGLEKDAPANVHFVGFRPNVRDYFAMADVGLVPTYFKGESYPLVVIECLMTGTPIIATDIAEVRNQLKDENEDLAGILLPLRDGKIDETDICTAIIKLVDDHEAYMCLKRRTYSACRKFNMSGIADKHLRLYQEMLATP